MPTLPFGGAPQLPWLPPRALLAPRAPLGRYEALQPLKPHTPVQHTIFEYPLLRWVDVAGSKVAPAPMPSRPARCRPPEAGRTHATGRLSLQVKPWDILRMAWGLCRIRVIYFYHEWPSGRCLTVDVRGAAQRMA